MPIPHCSITGHSLSSIRSTHHRVTNSPLRTRPGLIDTLVNLCSLGKLKDAVESVVSLSHKGVRLDSKSLAFLLRQCADSRALKEGKWIHFYLKETGRKRPDTLLSNHLINMYFKCGDHVQGRKVFDKMSSKNLYSWNNALSGYTKLGMLNAARRLFDKMPHRDVVSWNTMVIGYAQDGKCNEALALYSRLRRTSIELNPFSFAGVLIASMKLKDVGLARQVHCQTLMAGFTQNVVLASSILDAYAKYGEMGDARRMFDEMPVKDVFAWTILVSAYTKCGDMKSAKELFDLMPTKNPVSWTALISGYAQNGLGHKSLELFKKMMLSHIQPEQYTFSSCLSACGSITSLKHGVQIHGYIITSGFQPNLMVFSSLIDMYSKCGNLQYCRRAFKFAGGKQDVMIWNPMISALAQHGYGKEAIEYFNEMVKCGTKPNRVTFIVLISACSHSGLVEQGLSFFKSMTVDHDILPDEEHFACLIDLLGRAGRFVELIDELQEMKCKADDRIWNALIGVCNIHGNSELGKKTAERVIETQPDSTGGYILLSSIYATSGNWDCVRKVRELMEKRCGKKEVASSWIDIQDKVQSGAY